MAHTDAIPITALSYAAHRTRLHQGPGPAARGRVLPFVRPTRGGAWWGGRGGLGALGQAQTIDLPDGSSHDVLSVGTTGEILTRDGWASATQADGTERWINTHTGAVMLSDGTIIPAAATAMSRWWILGAVGAVGLVALVGLAALGAPVLQRRTRAVYRAGRTAWATS